MHEAARVRSEALGGSVCTPIDRRCSDTLVLRAQRMHASIFCCFCARLPYSGTRDNPPRGLRGTERVAAPRRAPQPRRLPPSSLAGSVSSLPPNRAMAAADDAFMGALEEAERELKASGCDAGTSSSAQTPATDATEEAGVTNSLPDDGAGDEPYAASDDEPAVSPTVGNEAPSTSHAKVERSGRGSDRHRSSANAEGRSAFKARVVKEVKLGAAHAARQRQAHTPRRTDACALRLRQRCVPSTWLAGSLRKRTSRSWRAT